MPKDLGSRFVFKPEQILVWLNSLVPGDEVIFVRGSSVKGRRRVSRATKASLWIGSVRISRRTGMENGNHYNAAWIGPVATCHHCHRTWKHVEYRERPLPPEKKGAHNESRR